MDRICFAANSGGLKKSTVRVWNGRFGIYFPQFAKFASARFRDCIVNTTSEDGPNLELPRQNLRFLHQNWGKLPFLDEILIECGQCDGKFVAKTLTICGFMNNL